MWRVGTPMKVSFDVNPVNDPTKIRGVPPVWYPDPSVEVFLADESGDLLTDHTAADTYLMGEPS